MSALPGPASARDTPAPFVAAGPRPPAPDGPYAGAPYSAWPTPALTGPAARGRGGSARRPPRVTAPPLPPPATPRTPSPRPRWGQFKPSRRPNGRRVEPDQAVMVGPNQPVTATGR